MSDKKYQFRLRITPSLTEHLNEIEQQQLEKAGKLYDGLDLTAKQRLEPSEDVDSESCFSGKFALTYRFVDIKELLHE